MHSQDRGNGCGCLWIRVQEFDLHVDAGGRALAEDERLLVPHSGVRAATCPYADLSLVTGTTEFLTGGGPDEE